MAVVKLTDMRADYLSTMLEVKLVRVDFYDKIISVKRKRRSDGSNFMVHTWGCVMLQVPPRMGTASMPIQIDGKWMSVKVDLSRLLIDYRDDKEEVGGAKAVVDVGYMILPIISFDNGLPFVSMPKYRNKATGEKKHSTWIVNKLNKPVMDEIGQAATDLIRALKKMYVLPTGPDIGIFNGRPMPSSCVDCKYLTTFRTFSEDGDKNYPFILPNPGLPQKKDDRSEVYLNTFCNVLLSETMEEAVEIWNGCQELDKYPVQIERRDGDGYYFAHAGFGTKKILFGNRLMDWTEVKKTIGKGDVCSHYRFSGLKANGLWAKVPPSVSKIYTVANNDLRPGFPEAPGEVAAANTGLGVLVTLHPAYTQDLIGLEPIIVHPSIREYNAPKDTIDMYELWKGVIFDAADDNKVGADMKEPEDVMDVMKDTLADVLMAPRDMQHKLVKEVLEHLELDVALATEWVEILDLMYSEQPKA